MQRLMRILGAIVEPTTGFLAIGVADLFHRRGIKAAELKLLKRFRGMKTLQKFSSVHAQVHNHFNQERHLVTREVYRQRRAGDWPGGAPFAARAACAKQAICDKLIEHKE